LHPDNQISFYPLQPTEAQPSARLLIKGLIEMNDLDLIFWPRRIGSSANITSEDLPEMNNSNEYWKA